MREIRIQGARTHNLKNVSVTLPQNQLVVITGPSGSGKSSLAFDTLFAEGQRRYLEGVSAYAKQFLGLLERPDADLIEGLTPSIAVRQQPGRGSSRSTVGTSTELNDFLKILFAKAGTPCCPTHHKALRVTPISAMAEEILAWPEGTAILVIAPASKKMISGYQDFFKQKTALGFQRLRIDGAVHTIDELKPEVLEASAPHSVDVVVDRLKLRPGVRERLSESLELAASMSAGRVIATQLHDKAELCFSTSFCCAECGFTFPVIQPSLFTPLADSQEGSPSDPNPAFLKKSYLMEAHHIFLGGPQGPSYPQLLDWSFKKLSSFFSHLHLSGMAAQIARPLLAEICSRIDFLIESDLGYLAPSRTICSLSRGEIQRIRLAKQLSSRLSGVTYVLDEPTAGLHASECHKLIQTLHRLRDQGNTIVAVEHNEAVMQSADYLIDMGPGAGRQGGHVCAAGTPKEIMASAESLSGAYLSGQRQLPIPKDRRSAEKWIQIEHATQKNLKKINIAFPVGCITAVTGVSGSGKSALTCDLLYEAAARLLNGKEARLPLSCSCITGLDAFDKVFLIDQSPIGRNPRSTPATYLDLFPLVRDVFAGATLSRERGYNARRFSFNAKGGRCEACQGEGFRCIHLQFLPDIYIPCDVCHGARYNKETLEARFKGLNIAEVLELSAADALDVFRNHSAIARKLQALVDVGLGYVKLGQPSHTLSGGECQRIKIAAELSKISTGRSLYILDEPTIGLHFKDAEILLKTLNRLCDEGNTIVLVEQSLSFIAAADWVIELGGRGSEGGLLVFCGTPEALVKCKNSLTAPFLEPKLSPQKA